MLFSDLLNFAGQLDAPTSNVSSSSLITLLLYVDFCPDCPALFPNRWLFLRAAIAGFFSCSEQHEVLLLAHPMNSGASRSKEHEHKWAD